MKPAGTNRIVVCGEVYSSNLGDQVIAHCLRYTITALDPRVEVGLLDLSGRRGHRVRPASAREPFKAAAVGVYQRLPAFARRAVHALMWFVSGRRRARAAFATGIADARVLVVGGGQLIADNELSFPLRLDELTRCAEQLGIPILFFACGVGGTWSWMGKRAARRALNRAKGVFVRDDLSVARLRALHMRPSVHVAQSIDPALISQHAFGVSRAGAVATTIGLGIMSPRVIGRHVRRRDTVNLAEVADCWIQVMQRLAAAGEQFRLFTNGSDEDREFCEAIAARGQQALGRQVEVFLPSAPAEFVDQFVHYKGVVAQRLHAAIVSVALGTPVVGLSWDDKVTSFFGQVGLPKGVVRLSRDSIDSILETLSAAIRSGPPLVDDRLQVLTEQLAVALRLCEPPRVRDAQA